MLRSCSNQEQAWHLPPAVYSGLQRSTCATQHFRTLSYPALGNGWTAELPTETTGRNLDGQR